VAGGGVKRWEHSLKSLRSLMSLRSLIMASMSLSSLEDVGVCMIGLFLTVDTSDLLSRALARN
jgi:hypothetical protein